MEVTAITEQLMRNIETIIIGKNETIRLCLAALISGGHVLIEDVPGLGKTVLARSLARSINASFRRIQFTPDLLPSDITGVSIYNQKTLEFEPRLGPVFANIVLADEINRATPRTQAGLLECMQENTVTIDGSNYPLPELFFVVATQNPVEFHGTYPLPEAQLDRFMLQLSMGYPSLSEETTMLARQISGHPLEHLNSVVGVADILVLRQAAVALYVAPDVLHYIVSITKKTREHPDIALGASPRASLAIMHVSKALALIAGRNFVVPDDIKIAARHALPHRLALKPEATLAGHNKHTVIDHILNSLPVPL